LVDTTSMPVGSASTPVTPPVASDGPLLVTVMV